MDSIELTNEAPAIDVASLWQDYLKSKSVELRNQLAEYYLPLIKLVAGRLAISLPAHVDRDDLLSRMLPISCVLAVAMRKQQRKF